ncbi:MAG TPA: hypothetical protein VFV47_04105 [Hyphomicrobiaceae bacterium]|nr:hypothetical protein [Hyphomicrobiaceae bacterium]
MSSNTWSPEAMAAFAALSGLKDVKADEIARLVQLGNKVVATSEAIPRMPRKTDEPASTFEVPL